MYQFSGRLKTFSIALILFGVIGLAFSFYNGSQLSLEDAKHAIEAASHGAHSGHGEVAAPHHEEANHHDSAEKTDKEAHAAMIESVSNTEAHNATDGHGSSHDDAHAEHVLHQLQNRPWSAFYVALFFSLGLTLLVLTFYAIQRVAQVGWSIVILRVMEAITANLLPVSIIMIVVLAASVIHINHLFPWMAEGIFDPESDTYDAIIDGKSWWMNTTGFMLRSIVYLLIWNAYRYVIRKGSIKEDTANDENKTYKKNYNLSVIFLFLFMITESMMSWDWIMSVDPHWFSTLFGWYVFASMFVSGITVIALITIYLKSKGLMEFVNDSHLHDLAKFMFAISVFWTYLWFSQFMLIWYANIPEEVTYFITRIEDYKLPFFGMLILNFIFPFLVLMNSDYKRVPWFIVMAGIVILFGHYIDVFNMIMPATVGDRWFIGVPEISAVLLFLGLFLWVVFYALSKAPLLPKGNPFIKESEQFHY